MNKQQQATDHEQQTNNNEVVVSVKNVSKKFCKNLKRSMAYGIVDLSKNLLGIKPNSTGLRKDEFWAVDDISFDLKRGEVLGLIGVNGSGKTTLLRLLAGIFPPDKGEISIKGKVGALIAIGAGFHPHMTGRENIYLNGTILGMTREEIDLKFQDVVDFAEIKDFINAPVSTYSSGMRVRLGFAIAIQINPDVMLIDEVLAVGDVGFRAKCFNSINEIMQKTAVIFVTHSMPHVSRLCSDIMVLQRGKTMFQGKEVAEGINTFYSIFKDEKAMIIGGGKAKVLGVVLESNGVKGIEKVNYLDELIIHIHVIVDQSIKHPNIIINFFNLEQQIIQQCSSYFNNFEIQNTGNEISVTLNLGKINLNPGIYFLEIGMTADNYSEILVRHQAIKKIQVIGKHIGYSPILLSSKWELN